MSAEDNLSAVQFRSRQPQGREQKAYHVKMDGKFIGHVAQHYDSSRTGGQWTAHRLGKTVSVGHSTRRDAAASVVHAYSETKRA